MALTKVSYAMINGDPINVLDYGAKGDSTNDDTNAIQAAIDASSGNTVYFPPGIYKTTAPLTVQSNTTLMGANRNVCIIRNNVSTIITTKEPLATRYYDIAISELDFDGVSKASQTGINLPHVSFARLTNIGVSNCNIGINFIAQTAAGAVTGAYYNVINNPQIFTCTTGIVFDKTANQNNVFAGKITQCTTGLYVGGTVNAVNFFGTAFEGNVTYGANVLGYNCSLVSCRFEGENTCTGIVSNPTVATYSNYVYAPYFSGLLASYSDPQGTITIIADSGMNLGIRTHVTAFASKRNAGGNLPMMYLQDVYTSSGNPTVYQSQQSRFSGYHFQGLDETGAAKVKITYYGEYECTSAGRGIFLRSPNGSRWSVTVSDAGAVVVTAA